MKRFYIFFFTFINCYYSFGQNSESISFIRFNSYIGYVIDSAENQKCSCVNFAGEKFSFGALIQLPDSSVVFRMKLPNKESMYNVPMSKPEVEKMSSKASAINDKFSSNDESIYLKALSGDSTSYLMLDYYNLKFKIPGEIRDTVISETENPPDSSLNYVYLNIGFGITSRSGIESYLGIAGDLGLVFRKNIYSGRVWYNHFVNPSNDKIEPHENITEFGLLYGRLFPIDKIAFTVNAGISYSTGILKGDVISITSNGLFSSHSSEYETIHFNEVGIPLKLEMLLGSRRKSKVSFAVYADLNATYCFYGFIVSLRPSNEYRPLNPDYKQKSKK